MGRAVALALVALTVGCASVFRAPETIKTKPGPGAVAMHEDRDLDWVWTAPDLNWAAYDTLYLAEPHADVRDLKPEDAESLEWARALLVKKFVAVLRKAKLFNAVVTRDEAVPAAAKLLRLDTVIVEYEKGNAALRALTGFGGHPLLVVQGRILDGGRPVFVFEERRGGGIRWRAWAGVRPNRDLQQADLTDSAQLLVDHIARVTGRRR